MAVDRGSFAISLVILAVLFIGHSILAKDADDSDEHLPSLTECKYHVLKALEQYWGTAPEPALGERIDLKGAESDGEDKEKIETDKSDKEEDEKRDENESDVEEKGDKNESDQGKLGGEDNKVREDSEDDAHDEDKQDDDEGKQDEVKQDEVKQDEGKQGDDEDKQDDDEDKQEDDDEDDKGDGTEDPKEDGSAKIKESDSQSEEQPPQEEITQAEVQELAAADDFVEAEDEGEEELETVEVPQTGRDHIDKIMDLEEDTDELQKKEKKMVNGILKDLKRVYDQIIKPMENVYKYKEISTRRFADAEIYSQPMVLFVGPWNSGKSTIINYLLDLEGTEMALDTGPASAGSQFIVLSHADKERKVDGTELAADWRFAGIQKFGQGFIDVLIGRKLPRLLLDKITIVEAPGIREKQKNLNYPFDDSLQWFIDRADIIYVVFDPSKLEMGHEVELLMDQLKGREKYLRFLVNKADTVDTENLMKVTSQLFWTLSPMLTTSTVPTSYTVSLWSKPYQEHADASYLSDHEVSMLRDLKKNTVDKLVENKLAHARRHAVTVRNHAKLVDCYLTHYYKRKSLFANKNKVASEVINNPDKFKIFESISAMNNVSRYDLPNPDIYKEFFKVNPLYDFKQLKDTCSYFKGCPIDKLNVCIAYDLPQLLGKYRKLLKELKEAEDNKSDAKT